MLGRPANQPGFADLQVSGRLNDNHFLFRMDREINWKRIRSRLEVLYDPKMGRPGFPPVLMLKTLLLQQWHNLSDPETEEAVRDRSCQRQIRCGELSFLRFLGLRITDPVPDETTICRFRNRLPEKKLYEKVFEDINRHLEEKGVMVRQGSIEDATPVRSHNGPATSRRGAGYPDAGWTRKRNMPHYGYKAHIAVDKDSELVRRVEMTPAHVHDTDVFEEMVSGDEEAVYADKGYYGCRHREYLEERDIFCGIMDKAVRGRRLEGWQERRNRLISRVRCAVERRFGVLKEHYGYVRLRYRGPERNRSHLFLLVSAMNLKRMLKLCPA